MNKMEFRYDGDSPYFFMMIFLKITPFWILDFSSCAMIIIVRRHQIITKILTFSRSALILDVITLIKMLAKLSWIHT